MGKVSYFLLQAIIVVKETEVNLLRVDQTQGVHNLKRAQSTVT